MCWLELYIYIHKYIYIFVGSRSQSGLHFARALPDALFKHSVVDVRTNSCNS